MTLRHHIVTCLAGTTMAAIMGAAPAQAVPPTMRSGSIPGPALAPDYPETPSPERAPEYPPITPLSRAPEITPPPQIHRAPRTQRRRLTGTLPRRQEVHPVAAVVTPPAVVTPLPEPARIPESKPAARTARLPKPPAELPGGLTDPRPVFPVEVPEPAPVKVRTPSPEDGTELPGTIRTPRDAQSELEARAYEESRRFRLAQNRVSYTTFSSGSPHAKLVSITFDDGPDAKYTPRVLQVLRKHKVTATFFLIGRKIDRYPNLVRRTAAEGHDIGNHTYHHFDLTRLGPAGVRFEIERTSQAIENAIGGPTRWFRAPGCKYNGDVFEVLSDMDLVRVDTTNNTGDWAKRDTQSIVNRVLKQLSPGDVILCHDNIPLMVEALPALIRAVRARGYEFVPLAELAMRAQNTPGFRPAFWPSHQGIVIEEPRRLSTRQQSRRRASRGTEPVPAAGAPPAPRRVKRRAKPVTPVAKAPGSQAVLTPARVTPRPTSQAEPTIRVD